MNVNLRLRFRDLAALACGLLLTLLAACDPNTESPFLVPRVGRGGPCTSEFTSMHMAGSFTNPQFSVPASPVMTLQRVGGTCVWRATVNFPEGEVLFKFVTNGAFDDDFVGDEAVTLGVPGGPYGTSRGSGSGNAIKVDVSEDNPENGWCMWMDQDGLTGGNLTVTTQGFVVQQAALPT